ncbi:MAG TPA: sugar ABC transporter permease, partial [Acetobacteraceae bacterium]|nr:sugar ABC transporter permease [Acetobacteraceae bacterium]
MSTTALPAAVYVPVPRKASSLRRWTEREDVFSWLMIIPPVVFLLLLVGYPLVYGVWLSLENRPVARPGTFVGLANFIADAHDPVFWQVVQNTFVYTFFATVLKMVGGLGLALVMNQDFKFKNLVRAL